MNNLLFNAQITLHQTHTVSKLLRMNKQRKQNIICRDTTSREQSEDVRIDFKVSKYKMQITCLDTYECAMCFLYILCAFEAKHYN